MKRSKTRRTSTLSASPASLFEILESRQHMSASMSIDPTANNNTGQVTINGDLYVKNTINVTIGLTRSGPVEVVSVYPTGSTTASLQVKLPAPGQTIIIGGTKGDTINVTGTAMFVKGNMVNVLCGSGNDHVIVDADDYVYVSGGKGNDKIEFKKNLSGSYASHFADGGDGNDTLISGNGSDYLIGGNGSDLLFGGDGPCNLYGGNGDDRLFAGTGGAVMDPGMGYDKCFGNVGNDTVILHAGYKTLLVDGGDNYDVLQKDTGAVFSNTVIHNIEFTVNEDPNLNGKG